MSNVSIEELEKEREELQKRANELRKKRDELHKKAKELAEERDELNAKIRELRVKIKEHKTKRDELNQRVKSAKEKRTELNRLYLRAKRKLRELERRKSLSLGINIEKLKRELRRLENEQMTQPMSPQKEKEIVERISRLHAKLRECEEKIAQDIRLKRAYEELNQAKERAERQHAEVEELAEKAQKEHEEMIKRSDVILCLACGTGAQVLRSCVDKEVICGVNSKFVGAVKRPNEFIRLCSLCGDCIINETDAICPIARCPKGMLNGPCGGVKDGKCEVFPEIDCVWINLYKKFPDKVKEIREAKDFSKSQEVFYARHYSFERKT